MSVPTAYTEMQKAHPDLLTAYEQLTHACATAGPLDAKTVALIKLATSLGAGLEGAAHSHARKALQAGWTPAELEHVAMLATPTLGFPSMMRNRLWIHDVTEGK